MKLICDCGAEISQFETGINGGEFSKCKKCGEQYTILRGDKIEIYRCD